MDILDRDSMPSGSSHWNPNPPSNSFIHNLWSPANSDQPPTLPAPASDPRPRPGSPSSPDSRYAQLYEAKYGRPSRAASAAAVAKNLDQMPEHLEYDYTRAALSALAAGPMEVYDDEPDMEEELEEEYEEREPKPWVCEWTKCGLEFEDQRTLVRHLHNEHMGPNKDHYSCKWGDCRRKGEKQGTRHSLITHVRAHTGERPYTCTQPNCNKTFTRSDAMNKHLRSIHAIPAEMANSRNRPKSLQSQDSPIALPHSGEFSRPGSTQPSGSPPDSPHPEEHLQSPYYRPSSPPRDLYPPSFALPPTLPPPPMPHHDRPPYPIASPGRRPIAARPHRPAAPTYHSSNHLPSPLQPTMRDYSRNPSTPPVTYLRYGSDADLVTDSDLVLVVPRIRNRVVAVVTKEDERALKYVREQFPRSASTTRTNIPGEVAGPEIDDVFDEMVLRTCPDESTTEIGRIGETGITGERSVYGRSTWGSKYIMAKAKLMLAEEEMRMRQGELINLLKEESAVKKELEAATAGRRGV